LFSYFIYNGKKIGSKRFVLEEFNPYEYYDAADDREIDDSDVNPVTAGGRKSIKNH